MNKYFTGTHVGANTGWQIDSGDYFVNHPGVLNPWDLPTNLKQAVGHPMIVTETSWVSPMDYQNEGPFLVAAYQSLTGVAGCYWFTATAERYEDDLRFGFTDANGQYPLHKWTCSTPELMGNFPAAALMYRQGYLKRGEPVIIENRPLADLWKRKTPLISEGLTFDPNRMSGQPGRQKDSPQHGNPLAFLVGPVKVNYGGDPAKNKIADLSPYIDLQKKTIASDTGQIHLDFNIGLCTVDAPAAQGATGFLQKAGPIHLGTIDIACTNEQASVLVVSMDGKQLSESRNILVQVGTPTRLTHWAQEPADFADSDGDKYHGFKIVKPGRPPWLIQQADVMLTIHNRNLTKMTALDMAGYSSRELPLRQSSDGVELEFPSHTMYAVLQ